MRRRKAAEEPRSHTGVGRAALSLWDAPSHGKGMCLCPGGVQGELLRLQSPWYCSVTKGEEESHPENVTDPPRWLSRTVPNLGTTPALGFSRKESPGAALGELQIGCCSFLVLWRHPVAAGTALSLSPPCVPSPESLTLRGGLQVPSDTGTGAQRGEKGAGPHVCTPSK